MVKKLMIAVSALSMLVVPAAANARHNDGDDNENGYSNGDEQGDQGEHRYAQQQRSYQQQRYYRPQQGYYQQQGYYPQQTYGYDNGYRSYGYRRHRCSGTTGTIVGAGAGALLGRSLGRGSGYYHRHSGTTGTILGGVLGALVGRQVGKSTC